MEPTLELMRQLRREKLQRVQGMSLEQKLAAGLELYGLAIESMSAGIRLQNPQADETEVRAIIRRRLEQMRRKDEVSVHGSG